MLHLVASFVESNFWKPLPFGGVTLLWIFSLLGCGPSIEPITQLDRNDMHDAHRHYWACFAWGSARYLLWGYKPCLLHLGRHFTYLPFSLLISQKSAFLYFSF